MRSDIMQEFYNTGMSKRELQLALKKSTGLDIGIGSIERALQGSPAKLFEELREDIRKIFAAIKKAPTSKQEALL